MEESLPPPDAESNVFDQFDVRVKEKLVPGATSTVDWYCCRVSPCCEERLFESRRALIEHRYKVHSLRHKGTNSFPEEDQIRQWLLSGRPRPFEIPPEHLNSRKPSLLNRLLNCKPETESELQPASLNSNVYEQFNVVRHEPGEAGGSPYVEFVCLLSECYEKKVCFNLYDKWTRHRRRVHKETVDAQSVTLPGAYEIREWVILNKPRPYEVPVKRKAWKKGVMCQVDPAVFAEFDVEEDGEQLRFFCLLDPCKEQDASFQGRRCWRKHRVKHHMSPVYEGGEYALPSEEIVRDWMNSGKPHDYKPRKGVRSFVNVDPPSADTNTELHNPEVNLTPSNFGTEVNTNTELHNPEVNLAPSNVGNEVNEQKSQVLFPLPEGKESRKCRSENQHSQGHHQELHELLTLEGCSSLRSSKSLARVGMFRPSPPPVEIPRESPRIRERRRPRNADAAGCSSATEPAHQKKKRRHTIRSVHRSHNTGSTGSDSSDLVAVRVVPAGAVPSGRFWKQFMEEAFHPSEEADEESDDGPENVDDLPVEQTVEDPINHDHNSADMEECGEEPREDSAQPEDALPSLPSWQPELHGSGGADVAEVDEDAHEEFEAPDNFSPSQPELQNFSAVEHSSIQPQDFQGYTDEHQRNSTAKMTQSGEEAFEEFEAPGNVWPTPELQNVKVAGHSSIQPQYFQGVTDEHQQNITAEMADADEESPKDSVASENVLPSLQISTAEMGEVEMEEELEDCVAPEICWTSLIYAHPKSWENFSAQPRDFEGDVLMETLPNPIAEMDEIEKEAPVAIENGISSLQPEYGITGNVEHDIVLPQELPGEMLPNIQMGEFGEAHEGFINPWNSDPSVPSNVSEQTAPLPLWHLNGDNFNCLPQDLNWPNSSKEDNLNSAEMAEFGDSKAPEEIAAAGNLSLSVQSGSSEQNALSDNYFTGLLLTSEYSPGETDNHKPNTNAGMAEFGVEAPFEGSVAPGNFVSWMQSKRTIEVPSLEGPFDILAAPTHEFVPPFSVDQDFGTGPNDAGMAGVGEQAPEGSETPESLESWILLQLMQSEGTKLGPISIQAAPIQETVPRVHMDPVFIEEPSAAGIMGAVGEESLEEFAAPVNWGTFLPSNAPQETGEQLCVPSLNTNASFQDPWNIPNEPIIHEYPWNGDSIPMDVAPMIEPVVVLSFAPSTQRGGSAEHSTENQVVPFQNFTNLMDAERAFEPEPDFLLLDDFVLEGNPEEFFHPEAVALPIQPTQPLSSPEKPGSSNNSPDVPRLQTDLFGDLLDLGRMWQW